MNPQLQHRPINDRDAATAADRQLLTGPRAAAARALHTMKGVDAADAERVRDDLLGLIEAPAKASAALAQLDELADAGLLDRKDLATKRAAVVRARSNGPA